MHATCQMCPTSTILRPNNPPHLPDHLVWPVTLSQAERTGKVAHKQWLLLDGSKESLVNCLLVRSAAARWLLLLLKELISLQASFEKQNTSGFSPCLKNCSSPFFLSPFSRAKYFSPETSSTFALSRPEISTFLDVAIT